jgi:hypothetical protein
MKRRGFIKTLAAMPLFGFLSGESEAQAPLDGVLGDGPGISGEFEPFDYTDEADHITIEPETLGDLYSGSGRIYWIKVGNSSKLGDEVLISADYHTALKNRHASAVQGTIVSTPNKDGLAMVKIHHDT